MKNLQKIRVLNIEGHAYTLFRFDAEDEHERYFGEQPYGCIDNKLLDNGRAKRAFNGFDINVNETAEGAIAQATITVKRRAWQAAHPGATETEMLQYLMTII